MRERDQEIEVFIRSCPRTMTYSEIEQGIRERFGEDRAWPRPRIVAFWTEAHVIHRGREGRIELDPEVRDFIDDRIGRLTYADLAERCRERFGARAPSRSTIHRHHQKLQGTGPYRNKRVPQETP